LSLDRLAPDQAAVVLEFALRETLDAIEASLGGELKIVSVTRCDERASAAWLTLPFTLVIEGLGTNSCEMLITPDHAVTLAQHLDRHLGIGQAHLDLPMAVCVRPAAARLTIGEIESLSPGDVVHIDTRCRPADSAIAVIGEHLVAPVELTPQGGRLASHPTPGHNSPWAWSMARTTDASPDSHRADADGHDLPLHVAFELGRLELPLGKIRQLAPNVLLPFARPLEDALDIVVEGRRIGRGVPTRDGSRRCVRVTSLSTGANQRSQRLNALRPPTIRFSPP
jgi:type III secretion protein Q